MPRVIGSLGGDTRRRTFKLHQKHALYRNDKDADRISSMRDSDPLTKRRRTPLICLNMLKLETILCVRVLALNIYQPLTTNSSYKVGNRLN